MCIDATTRAAADLGFSCIVVHIEIPRCWRGISLTPGYQGNQLNDVTVLYRI
jgi:hypothetical protein